MITLTRKGLTLSISEGMIPARGSQNVPVRYVNDIDEYANYLITPVVGWTERNGLPKSSIAEYSDGIIKLPARAFAQSCMASIAIKMTNPSDPTHVEVTYPQSFFIEKAPDGTLILPPTDEEWKQYIDDFVTQYFDQNIDPEMDEFKAEIIQNQTDFKEQMNEDFDNFIERTDGNPDALYRGYLVSKNNVYSGVASNDGINLGKVVGKSIQNGTPTPDSPVPIENVEITKLYSHTRNLFDASKLPTTSQGGATITNNGDGSFTVSGTGSLTTTCYSAYTYPKELASKLLKVGILRGKVEKLVSPSYVFGIYTKSGGSLVIALYGTLGLDVSANITQDMLDKIQSEEYVLRAIIYDQNGTEIKPGTIKPMVYYDGDGTFEPFQFNEVSTNFVLRSLPNGVADTYEKGVITRRVGVVTFDGSSDEGWVKNTVAPYSYQIYLKDIKGIASGGGNMMKCDHFAPKDYNSIAITHGEFRRGGGGLNQVLVFRNEQIATDTIEDWKTWLQSNPIMVEYELATPTTEYIDVPTIPSYYPNTVACHNSVVEPTEIEWHVETEKGLENTYVSNGLVNGDFQINPRGEKIYTGTSSQRIYTVAMWSLSATDNVTLTVNDDKTITIKNDSDLDCSLGQKIDINNFPMTGSLKIKNEKAVPFILDSDAPKPINSNVEVLISNKTGGYVFYIRVKAHSEYTFEYARLNEGLVNYKHVKEDEATALIKSLPYVERAKFTAIATGAYFMNGFSYKAGKKSNPIIEILHVADTNGSFDKTSLGFRVIDRYYANFITYKNGSCETLKNNVFSIDTLVSCEPLF